MNRRKFLGTAGITTVGLAGGAYLMSDKKNFIRGDITDGSNSRLSFRSDEKEILYLASLA
ncbi:MAG: twin-arginine translocation signal domain-containing protein, partial [Cyclobacteriaceae bacterium]|nr:twin-arginine translocation signal domain-containing protein [Cyclobacteriaceae bacterium]